MNLKTISAAVTAAFLAVGMTACHRDNAGAGSTSSQYGKRGSAATGSSSSAPSSMDSPSSSSAKQAPGSADTSSGSSSGSNSSSK